MKVTHAVIESVKTRRNGFTRKQLAILGVAWPPKKGWKDNAIGREITDKQYEELQRESRKS